MASGRTRDSSSCCLCDLHSHLSSQLKQALLEMIELKRVGGPKHKQLQIPETVYSPHPMVPRNYDIPTSSITALLGASCLWLRQNREVQEKTPNSAQLGHPRQMCADSLPSCFHRTCALGRMTRTRILFKSKVKVTITF